MRFLVNGRSVKFADDPTIHLITEDKIEYQGDETVEQRFTELDEFSPDGRFRIRGEGGELLLQRATWRFGETEDEHWTTFDTIMRFNSAGLTVDLAQDPENDLLEQIVIQMETMDELLKSVLH